MSGPAEASTSDGPLPRAIGIEHLVRNVRHGRFERSLSGLTAAARAVMKDMHDSAGAEEAITINRYAHLIGGCRMAADETKGVMDANLRSFAISNLFVVDGSVCPTQGSANPALTIMALATRAADYLGHPGSVL